MRELGILAALLLLAACGGGGAPAQLNRRTLQLFGDSTMRNMAPDFLAIFGERVEPRGVGSTTSGDLIAGTDGRNLPWPQSVTADVVLMNHALNDTNPAPLGTPIDQYRANLRRLADAPAIVVFVTPNPLREYNPLTGADPVRVAQYAQAMREVAAETRTPLIDVHTYCLRQPDLAERLADNVHPDAELRSRIVRDCLLPGLAPFVTP